MSTKLKITQLISAPKAPSSDNIEASIQLTNTSDLFLNGIKLMLNCHDNSILEQVIIRERGALTLDNPQDCLDIGNLAPNETAYFHYKFKPNRSSDEKIKLSPIKITYVEENSDSVVEIITSDVSEAETD